MNTAELLLLFCAPETDTRKHLHRPFRFGGSLAATNGHVLIRVPDDLTIVANNTTGFPEYTEACLDKLLLQLAQSDNYHPITITPPEPTDCPCCEGSGMLQECPKCNGEGVFERHGHEYECKHCHGEGYVKTSQTRLATARKTIDCTHCDGSGHNPHQSHMVGKYQRFARRYTALLATLPQLEMSETKPANPEGDTAFFRFAGGQIAIMPCR